MANNASHCRKKTSGTKDIATVQLDVMQMLGDPPIAWGYLQIQCELAQI